MCTWSWSGSQKQLMLQFSKGNQLTRPLFTLHRDYRKKIQNRLKTLISNNNVYECSYVHSPCTNLSNFYLCIRKKLYSNTNAQIEISINWCMENRTFINIIVAQDDFGSFFCNHDAKTKWNWKEALWGGRAASRNGIRLVTPGFPYWINII